MIIPLLNGHCAPEVSEHASSNTNVEHKDVIEHVVCSLHSVTCPNKDPKVVDKEIEEIIDLFCD